MQVSIVIPVYNEADRITDCLQAVAAQTVLPQEVIVVDNNSTDGTAVLAARFPFVRVIQESRQGVVYARDAGFSAAKGDIIGRIDADSIVAPDWVEQLINVFADSDVGAVSGVITYRDICAPRLVSFLDLFWRRRMARLLADDIALQGANMALRHNVWLQVQAEVCHQSGQHEDFDLCIHVRDGGHKTQFDERLQVSVCYRQATYNFKSFCHYALLSPRTYLKHGVKSGRYMYEVVAVVILLYPIACLLSRGYDKRFGHFTWGALLATPLPTRVNPATFVD